MNFCRTSSLTLLRLGLVLASSCAVGRAEPAAAEAASDGEVLKRELGGHLTEWRNSLQAEIKFNPAARVAVPDGPKSAGEKPADPDVYRLPTYVVQERLPNFRRLEYEIKAATAAAREADQATTVGRKLGIGMHTVKFRHFEMGVMTLFFVPISVGFSW